MGKFEVDRERVGDIDVRVAFNRSTPFRLSEGVRREVMETIRRSLDYYERAFGPYPLDHLTVVTLPRRYSQSFLGFVTLSDSILPPNVAPGGTSMEWYRSTTIAHEVAHQWWGNLIGWSSYRDQWLSEAMANYSAMQFWADTEEGGAAFLAEMSAGWRQTLSQPTPVGRTVEALGPIVLGERLNSTLADNGYRAIVYRKGAVVLAMLARIVGQQPFNAMMRSLAEVASNRVVSTKTFLEALEHMSGLDLDGFANRYIYGTGIPKVYYDYEISGDDENGWRLDGDARLLAEADHDQVVRPFGAGNWDVRRSVRPRRQPDASALMVPFSILLDDGGLAESQGAPHRRPTQSGNLMLEGRRDRFLLTSEVRPLQLTLDPRGEILASFYSRRTHPKRFAVLEAENRLIAGDTEGAESAYRKALAVEAGPPDKVVFAMPWLEVSPREFDHQDARIHLRLARFALDRDDEALALSEIDAAVAIVGPDSHELRIEQAALECRIDLRRGDFDEAFKKAKRALRLFSPQRQQGYWRLRGWQAQVGGWLATTDVLAVLAVAAMETGHNAELRWALEGASDRGVDLSALDRRLGQLANTGGSKFDTLAPPQTGKR
jgi:tetratricopeptide (TPR) repeat protein